MEVFKKYANYYDKVYSSKEYGKEVLFLMQAIKKFSTIKVKDILSLGCGTATHDILFAKKGFNIFGIDKSKEMIDGARVKAKSEGVEIDFKVGDVTKLNFIKKFDFVMAMFNIVGYMTENDYMDNMLKGVSKNLKKGGLFVFDGWYGPAVLKSRPENKDKVIENGLVRKTTQKLDIERSIININFKIMDKGAVRANETHQMRFWYLKELESFAKNNGFSVVKICNFLNINSKVSEDNWNIFVVLKKI